ncbi:MAG: nitroreductase family protein, partial [Promethearchaeota archaeon]
MDSTELLNLIKSRRSIRAFKPDPIPDDVLNIILEAGRWSQSANNRQPWRFVVIRKREIIQKLAKLAPYGKFINEAPILLAIIADKKIAPKWYLHDTCILTCQICLMAWSLGI